MKICLVANKCDLREDPVARERVRKYGGEMIEYEQVRMFSLSLIESQARGVDSRKRDLRQGLNVAKRIRASRYLGEHPLVGSRLERMV